MRLDRLLALCYRWGLRISSKIMRLSARRSPNVMGWIASNNSSLLRASGNSNVCVYFWHRKHVSLRSGSSLLRAQYRMAESLVSSSCSATAVGVLEAVA